MISSTARRLAAVADGAARWRNADFPARVRATRAIEKRTGYTEPVVDYALDALFAEIDVSTLRATIESELGSLDALENFVRRPGRPDVLFHALARATIVSSDTTIGVAIPALAFAICAGCNVVVKDRDDGLVAAFVSTIVEEAPELRERIVTALWDGRTADDTNDEHLGAADVVVAFGSDDTLTAIRSRLKPDARFVPYGHRTSIAYADRESLADDASARTIARAAARDSLLYDGEGCLSTHVLFVETGANVSVAAFAKIVADACDDVAIEFPAGYASFDNAVVAYHRTALFRAAQGEGAAYAGTHSPHLIVLDQPRDLPPPLLRRTLAIYGVCDPSDAADFLRRHRLPLEAVALSPHAREDVVAFAVRSGAARIAPLGFSQRPPLGGEHGGHARILPFVRAIYR